MFSKKRAPTDDNTIEQCSKHQKTYDDFENIAQVHLPHSDDEILNLPSDFITMYQQQSGEISIQTDTDIEAFEDLLNLPSVLITSLQQDQTEYPNVIPSPYRDRFFTPPSTETSFASFDPVDISINISDTAETDIHIPDAFKLYKLKDNEQLRKEEYKNITVKQNNNLFLESTRLGYYYDHELVHKQTGDLIKASDDEVIKEHYAVEAKSYRQRIKMIAGEINYKRYIEASMKARQEYLAELLGPNDQVICNSSYPIRIPDALKILNPMTNEEMQPCEYKYVQLTETYRYAYKGIPINYMLEPTTRVNKISGQRASDFSKKNTTCLSRSYRNKSYGVVKPENFVTVIENANRLHWGTVKKIQTEEDDNGNLIPRLR